MAFLKKSLAEDSIDRYSHTWVFLFLLLLSIVCLFVSLSPSMTLLQSKSSNRPDGINQNGPSAKMGIVYPTYKASCWTPAHFQIAHVIYVNTICSSKLNSIVQGENFSGARIHQPINDVIPINPEERKSLQRVEDLLPSSEISKNQTDAESSKDKGQNDVQTKMEFIRHEEEKFQSGLQDLISYKTPLYLFLLAICLRLPHSIWSILSTWCGCINNDQTLTTAQTTQLMDSASQQKIRGDIALTVGKYSKKSSALLYLLMKLLTVAVVCVEIAVVGHGLLEENDKLENDAASLKMQIGDIRNTFQDLPGNLIYICDFQIMQLDNMQHFSVQCVFTQEANSSRDLPSRRDVSGLNQPNEFMTQKRILLLYKALFTIVLATLVILAICNISSLLVWLLKLMLSSCRESLGLKTDACLDVVFLVSMAWCNTSAIVAMDLAKSSAWSDGSSRDNQGESMRMKDDLTDS